VCSFPETRAEVDAAFGGNLPIGRPQEHLGPDNVLGSYYELYGADQTRNWLWWRQSRCAHRGFAHPSTMHALGRAE
jgi:hypothetical protein